jgi:hypothetical protein
MPVGDEMTVKPDRDEMTVKLDREMTVKPDGALAWGYARGSEGE